MVRRLDDRGRRGRRRCRRRSCVGCGGIPSGGGRGVRARMVICSGGMGVASWSWRSGCRLWVLHCRRPLNWSVMPPSPQGMMWSMSHSSAGVSQPEGCWQCRSRTWMARRTAPVKLRRRDVPRTVVGPSNRTTSMSAVSRCGRQRGGGQDPSGRRLTELGEGVVTEQDGEQRSGPLRAFRGRCRAGGHLDQCGGAALGGGAGDPIALVSQPLLAFEPAQLGQEDRAADRVEGAVDDDGALERLRRVQGRRGGLFVVVVAGVFGVGALLPVGNGLCGLPEPQPCALLDQQRLVDGEPLRRHRPSGRQQPDVIRRQHPGRHGGCGGRDVVELSGVAQRRPWRCGWSSSTPGTAGPSTSGTDHRTRSRVTPTPPTPDRPPHPIGRAPAATTSPTRAARHPRHRRARWPRAHQVPRSAARPPST